MIKSISVTNHLNETIKMELVAPEKSGFAVLNIDGLGPPKANINSTSMSTGDGAIYNSSRLEVRNIVIQLSFLYSPTIEFVRQKSYKYFPIKKRIKLTIETDNRLCEIYGYVESNEPTIFSKDEGTQISIICPDPYFYSSGANGTTITVFAGVVSNFEFPFGNDSLTEPLMELGVIQNSNTQTVYYQGDADIGMKIIMKALGEVSNLVLYNLGTWESLSISDAKLIELTGSLIVAGDMITLTTIKGSKSIILRRNGVDINILNTIEKDADWFQLSKGDNVFAYTADYGLTNLQFSIENRKIYEGV